MCWIVSLRFAEGSAGIGNDVISAICLFVDKELPHAQDYKHQYVV